LPRFGNGGSKRHPEDAGMERWKSRLVERLAGLVLRDRRQVGVDVELIREGEILATFRRFENGDGSSGCCQGMDLCA
jgi:hypothetical protein